MFSHQQPHFTLFGEALEERCLLSVNSPLYFAIQSVELPQACYSQLVEPSIQQSPQRVFGGDLLVNSAGPQPLTDAPLTDALLTVQPADTGAAADGVQLVALIAVPPDDSIGPFVECPGLDPDFCLPREIDFDFDIDILDRLIFGSQTTAETTIDTSFDRIGRVGQSGFLQRAIAISSWK
jgi:hypothetical protein